MVTLRESASDASGPTVRNLSSDCESVLPGNQGDEIRDMKTDDVPSPTYVSQTSKVTFGLFPISLEDHNSNQPQKRGSRELTTPSPKKVTLVFGLLPKIARIPIRGPKKFPKIPQPSWEVFSEFVGPGPNFTGKRNRLGNRHTYFAGFFPGDLQVL